MTLWFNFREDHQFLVFANQFGLSDGQLELIISETKLYQFLAIVEPRFQSIPTRY